VFKVRNLSSNRIESRELVNMAAQSSERFIGRDPRVKLAQPLQTFATRTEGYNPSVRFAP
jgi:hypothetical protein